MAWGTPAPPPLFCKRSLASGWARDRREINLGAEQLAHSVLTCRLQGGTCQAEISAVALRPGDQGRDACPIGITRLLEPRIEDHSSGLDRLRSVLLAVWWAENRACEWTASVTHAMMGSSFHHLLGAWLIHERLLRNALVSTSAWFRDCTPHIGMHNRSVYERTGGA